ncbi:MAG TPA: single-stranded-DNA-specific exonuclease RecJ [Balneola sp.]|jgi:single-stranded-DNA-specific exonuclease|nr:single-stranded-DNA-specific exonuclease RecJ [Balneola sp.]MAO76512.1 single-stranded-DNA-specific exonuclease RecJ [Balneola sp.]MBF65993.1 single-stranded-DNA-specific exonuclease RecJ [Balneola sp.]HAH52002.1 single-stranded-DNA-specific exonuclease RecJ [Balneola sp.]HAW78775.1 single-stranded-DNA-specific exonuclease RecJ [Balneola sp.]|tara:strand:- start:274 stop:1974 length:1701 start_codon:yes stop_codon:yes gene_type:complete
MSFRWVFAQQDQDTRTSVLKQKLGVPAKIAELLAIRGIETYDDAKLFFRPTIDRIHDPFLMKDMDQGADRLALAIRNGERVLVYGDYDVDGTTATSCLYIFLKKFGVDVDYYIPHRFKEGYGINPDGIKYAEETGCHLIVSVDCGITAIKEALVAKEKGIDLIICDHHTVGDEIPDALAVLDPKRPDCTYPFDGLSGAGVGFKLIQGTISKLGLPKKIAYQFLDLVAISIASDIVPIVDENRILMKEGLTMIRKKPRVGIKALLDLIRMPREEINTTKIVFSIGPRINAAGRMGDATTAVQLMIAENEAKGKAFAHELESVNMRRRDKDSKTMEEALSMIDDGVDLSETSIMVLYKEDWHLGVIGIVASRLVDLYHRPAIMLSSVEGVIKGSGRSIRGFNIYNAMKKCEDLLEQFGGHEFAAGLTIKEGKLTEFKRRMNEIAYLDLSENTFEPELQIDTELSLEDIDMKFWKLLNQFEPFGPHNLRPIFVSKKVEAVGVPTIVGNGHLKMKVKQGDSGVFDAIGFNMHEYLPFVRKETFDMAYVVEENDWNGRRTLQIRIKDIHQN